MAARFLFSVFLLFIFLLFKPALANAQTVNPPQNLHTYTQSVMIETLSSMTCLLAGVDIVDSNQKCLGIENGKIGPVDAQGGAIGAVSNMIAMTFTPPLHTGDYVRYLAGNFGIAKPAYADQSSGFGFQSLTPLLEIWKAFRNISYLLFVIIFVVIGFAIMLRIHIDPRTVMSIENQIPKIIVGLLMVTFSFAIAGLLIDLMYFLIYLSIGIFSTIPGVNLTQNFYGMQGYNPIEVANNLPVQGPGGTQGILAITMNTAGSVKDILVNSILSGPFGKVVAFAIGGALGFGGAHTAASLTGTAPAAAGVAATGLCAVTGVGIAVSPLCFLVGQTLGQLIIGAISGGAAAVLSDQFLGTVASILAFIIIGAALLFALIRLWFTLIQAYIFILIDVVFAPFWIIGGILPGSSIGFGAWIRDLSANLLAFPATVVMFLLGYVFINAFSKSGNDGFAPPLLGNANEPNLFGSLIGLGIIFLTPGVTSMIKKAFKAPESNLSPITAAIGAGVGYPLGVARRFREAREASKQWEIKNEKGEYGQRGWLGSFFKF